MLSLPRDITSSDVEQWLRSCFFIVMNPGSGPRVATYDTQRETGRVVYNYRKPDGNVRRGVAARRNVRPHWPECGAINVKEGVAVYLRRKASRQYTRSYRPKLVQVVVPDMWYLLKKDEETADSLHSDDWAVVEAAFNPSYPLYPAAVNTLRRGGHSVALNRHIILSCKGGDRLRVHYRGKLVGRIDASHTFRPSQGLSPRRVQRIAKLIGGASYDPNT